MKRFKANKKRDRKVFKKTATRTQALNVSTVMRGGIRL